jgi:2-polyprenyl-3-methyl-5-hydroxy-6-metoxy-1,4-benzoquinol methylase
VSRCDICSTEASTPPPSSIQLLEAYQNFNAGEYSRDNFSELTRLSEQILLKDLQRAGVKKLQNKNLLDYGCGGGHFVQAAKNLGMNAIGLEVDPANLNLNNSLDIRELKINDPLFLISNREVFDVILINHVLEHVFNPSEVLNSLSRKLSPNGLIIIRTPDQSSIPAKIKIILHKIGLRKWEYGFVQPPIHLHGFTMKSFDILARNTNLTVKELKKTSPLNNLDFPTNKSYWENLKIQRLAYNIGRIVNSGGHILCILHKN